MITHPKKQLWIAGLVILGLAWSSAAHAVACNKSKDDILTIPGLGTFDAHTTGTIFIDRGNTFVTSDGHTGWMLNIQSMQTAGDVEGLGHVTYQFDPTRQAPASSFTSNQVAPLFPGKMDIYMSVNVTIDGLGSFRSMKPAHVVSPQVSSFPPSPSTPFFLQERLDLENVQRPGVVAASIAAGKTVTIRP
jgi:hypothetical protein